MSSIPSSRSIKIPVTQLDPQRQRLRSVDRVIGSSTGTAGTGKLRISTLAQHAIALSLAIALIGCNLLGGGNRQGPTVYAPDPRVQQDPAWPQVTWQLSISRPDGARVIDSLRIAVRPTPEELQVYKDANWAKTPGEQVEDTVLRALEDSGKIQGVGRQGTGIAANYKLSMDLRRYEADYAGSAVPTAVIEINAKLLHAPGNDVAASRTFLQQVPTGTTDMVSVNRAFTRALAKIGGDIAGWTLISGEAHERDGQHRWSREQEKS